MCAPVAACVPNPTRAGCLRNGRMRAQRWRGISYGDALSHRASRSEKTVGVSLTLRRLSELGLLLGQLALADLARHLEIARREHEPLDALAPREPLDDRLEIRVLHAPVEK